MTKWVYEDRPKEVEMAIRFRPEKDITAYELAYIASKVGGSFGLTGNILVLPSQWQNEPSEITRHFE